MSDESLTASLAAADGRDMILGLAAALLLLHADAAVAQVAHLKEEKLIVDGKPCLLLGGQPGNTRAPVREWLQPHWVRLQAMHQNTVLGPVSSELVEPQ